MGVVKRTQSATLPGGYPLNAEPFLAAIVANPDDDTVRLVFADWLDEHGEPQRAEFIRAQIELFRHQPDYNNEQLRQTSFTDEEHALYERQRTLLAENRMVWLVGLPRWAVSSLWQSFHRGFPSAVQATPKQWLQQGEFLRRWVPIQDISLDATTDYPQLIASPSLIGLKKLSLQWIGNAELRTLADSPVLDTVESLSVFGRWVSYPTETAALQRLFDSPRLGNVRFLRVHFDAIGDTIGTLLAQSPQLRNLQMLILSGTMHGRAACELFDSPNLANVTHLELSRNPIGDFAIRSLVRSKHVNQLKNLILEQTELTAESGRLLAGWPGMQTIGYLNLTYNNLELAGVRALSESPYLNQLHTLQLYGNVDWRQSSQVKSLPGFAHIRNLKS